KLYSLDNVISMDGGSEVDGIALKFPLVRPFIIPKSTYGSLTNEPIVTIATDMMYVVREGMGETAVSDLLTSLFEHREQFVHVNPSFFFGIIEDFDRSKLSYPLHRGARAYLERDQPGFLERYAELAGVALTIFIAIGSGVVSLTKWRKQKKKDQVDVFYEHLLKIKNEIPAIFTVQHARESIQEVKAEQNRAFSMLINEELEANDSFRIYMELSKETIDEIRSRYRLIKTKV
ncbi:MAG: TAXI family TRAP transporter solute-binding subunit, partial [Cyclobacteriaceae bacterium]